MAHEFKTKRRVEFADTDVAGVVHFSNYFRYLEVAEHEFFRSLGIRLHGEDEGGMFGWARVHASCDYLRPARYADMLEMAQSDPLTVAWAEEHHKPAEEWTIDPAIAHVLRGVDDD